ncbi:hypothetical protein SteCoe_32218 [Stentor coeruleus]|uniref:Uncharacterized protein n=1 Tax=Stentor coeruleus TaxID=5963 RepID=A0A1R2AZF8_9CILI|nr:hypothetical protein SteCoe_32218 [Stentor coeruleus]
MTDNINTANFEQSHIIRKDALSKTYTPTILSFKKVNIQSQSHRNSIFEGLDWDYIFHGPEARKNLKLMNKTSSVPKKSIISPKDLNKLSIASISRTPVPKKTIFSPRDLTRLSSSSKTSPVSRKTIVSPRDLSRLSFAVCRDKTPIRISLGQTSEVGKKSARETAKTTNASHEISSDSHIECQTINFTSVKFNLEQIREDAKQCLTNSKAIIQKSRKRLKSPTSSTDTRRVMSAVPPEISKEIIEELAISIQMLNKKLKSNEKATSMQEECNNVLKSQMENLKTKIAKHKIFMESSPSIFYCCLPGCRII